MTDLFIKKQALRNEALRYRQGLSEKEKESLDKKIENKLLKLWQYCESDVILIYKSARTEITTDGIILDALKKGKQVYLPRCDYNDTTIDFYRIDGLDNLEKRRFGLFEPPADGSKRLSDFSQGLCIVPALVFDRQGNRIGYGRGYYDRFLCNFSGFTAGLCYDRALKQEIPFSKHDVKIQTIVTQSEIFNTKDEGRHLI